MGQADRRLCFPLGVDVVVARRALSPSDAEYLRCSLANAVTAILLQAEVIRRHMASGMLQEPAIECATEQIGLNAKQIWQVVEATVLESTT
ncbi:hypothetical protein [Ancylobacter pratisalsi]|uniref:Uncharacterized protein n=1 Tax=Ancylobacter pratisalsi TaxID=1745854 RepID=A0A6P1YS51_9HYPH|nr:hypothetical protein [Ancylobacter pratisalsi]QIB34534.1 hypothetical protein G3A50_13040 [Ancylobacter pratisalsi]